MKKVFALFTALVLAAGLLVSCAVDTSSKEKSEYGWFTLGSETEDSVSRQILSGDLTSVNVTVSGYGFSDIEAENVIISGTGGTAEVKDIPVGKNRIITVTSNVTGGLLRKAVDIRSGDNGTISVTWADTASADVLYELLKTYSQDITKIDASVFLSYIPEVHASLVDAASIAEDYVNNELSSSEDYILENGTVKITASNCDGASVQVTDIASESYTVSGSSETKTLTCYPGTWKVRASLNGTEKLQDVTVYSGYTTTVTIDYGEAVTDKIIVKLSTSNSNGYNYIWAWNGSTNYTTSGSWPGDALTDSDSDGYYEYTINATSSNVIFDKSSGGSSASAQTGTLPISEPGIWVYNGSGFDKESGEGLVITVTEPVIPVKPTVTLPSSSVSLSGSFDITVTSNCEVSSGSVTINGTTKTLSNGKNSFSVSDFASEAGTYTITGSVTNEAGTTAVSGSLIVVEKPAVEIISDWNKLTIYQVMVASFQDGDSSIGYTQMWGPDNQLKSGDLQGIIDAIPYIKELGCNALWMTPIFPSNCSSEKLNATGYFACDYFNIDSHFGTMKTFDTLVSTCHENGIAVILDGVFGHNSASQGGSIGSVPDVSGVQNAGVSPSGSNPVDYAGNSNSIKYYSDVARYWITEHKIDGWRFDQCYQVGLGDKSSSDNTGAGGHNYWYDIRKVIEEAAASNGTKGQKWGTLGYMVGEHWNGDQKRVQAGSVASGTAKGYGLQGCFDFPAYYCMVQGFAQEYGNSSKSTNNITTGLSYLYQTYSEKGYECIDDDGSEDIYYPNFMLTNHDLYRIGDILKDKWGCSYDSDEYIKRNEVMLAAQAAYTGPVTIYYGDEIGDHSVDLSGWGGDNVARSSGKITGFNTREQTIHDYEQKVLAARTSHEALWNGTNKQITGESDFYVAKKTYGSETIYIAFNWNSSSSKSFSASGTDLLTGKTYSGTVTVPALSAVYVLEN